MPETNVAGYSVRDGVAIITMASPPVNALNHALRSAITECLQRAAADPGVCAIVLTGSDRAFSAGADVREFGTERVRQTPSIHEVNDAIENSPKPVVAAISGVCLGGGLEVALCCHYRIAAPQAQLGLPEVKLGLIPGAGGTQRLPRLIGVQPALEMIFSSQPAPALQFVGTPLVQAIATGDLIDAAVPFAKEVASKKQVRVRDLPVHASGPHAREKLEAILARSAGNPALAKAAEAVTASLTLPFDAALAIERKLLLELMDSPESLALRQSFLGRSGKKAAA
jgi:3-hydroxyacyl-CoA dehydrogenase